MSLVLTGTSGASNLDSTNGLQFATWTTATRPASPIVGQMGYNTTTNAFDAYVNGAWVSIATSSTAPVSGPAFSVYSNASTTLPGSATTKVAFQVEDFDTASCFNNTASTVGSIPSYSFLPTVAGYYQFNAAIQYSGTTAGQVGVYKNGSLNKAGLYTGVGGTNAIVICSCLIYLNGTTDYADCRMYIDSGTTTLTANWNTYFQGFLVRTA